MTNQACSATIHTILQTRSICEPKSNSHSHRPVKNFKIEKYAEDVNQKSHENKTKESRFGNYSAKQASRVFSFDCLLIIMYLFRILFLLYLKHILVTMGKFTSEDKDRIVLETFIRLIFNNQKKNTNDYICSLIDLHYILQK